jgi:glycosyltransferase involved in cell wall biosynthesis
MSSVEIHQILAGASYGDAVTNEALSLREAFRKVGPSEIFAFNQDGVVADVRRLQDYPSDSRAHRDRVLVVHHSIGEPAVSGFLAKRHEPLVLRYHNITPPAFFESFDPAFARLLALGREELREMRPRVTRAVADSEYNASELREFGYTSPTVVPLVLDARRLVRLHPRRPPPGLPERHTGPVVLFVGRIAPNKGQHLLMQAFHVLKTYLRRDAHLLIVGKPSQLAYAASLTHFLGELALPDVTFMGHVSDQDLAAIYRRADVFCCLSAHEGFGVPLVESMAFELPIVAWGTTAVSETVGPAGLLLDEPRPALVAEALAAVLEDSRLRTRLASGSRDRLRELDSGLASRRLLEEVRKASA